MVLRKRTKICVIPFCVRNGATDVNRAHMITAFMQRRHNEISKQLQYSGIRMKMGEKNRKGFLSN